MIKREFTAKIVDNFKARWIYANAKDENTNIEAAQICYGGAELDALHNRISGKRVTLVEHEYPRGSNDFFEKEDNAFVIYRELFSEDARV